VPKAPEISTKVVCVKLVGAEICRRLEHNNEDAEYATSTRTLLLLLRRFVADGGDPWGAEMRRKVRVGHFVCAWRGC